MARGRKQGWEEKIQHAVLCRHLIEVEKVSADKIRQEFPVDPGELRQKGYKAKLYADFFVDREYHYEIIECKDHNHPSFNVGPALGQVLVYRQMIETRSSFPNGDRKKIKLGLCFVDGFTGGYGRWTEAHAKLIMDFAQLLGEPITVYRVSPVKPEFADERYWWEPKNFNAEGVVYWAKKK